MRGAKQWARWCGAVLAGHCLLVLLALAFGHALPVGGQLVYEVRSTQSADLYLLDTRHRLTHNLTRQPEHHIDTQPAWSPDGRYMAFESRQEGKSLIYVMGAEGRGLRPLAPHVPGNQYNPRWSDDSTQVIFQARSRLNPLILSVELESGRVLQLPAPSSQSLPVMLPPRLPVMVYREGRWGISVYDGSWRSLRHLTDSDVRFRETPQWSADGQQIAFISAEPGQTDIYVMDFDGGGFRRVTQDGSLKTRLVWRP